VRVVFSGWSGSLVGVDVDAVSELLQPGDEAVGIGILGSAFEVLGAELLIGSAILSMW
jgi:hypothetical protein